MSATTATELRVGDRVKIVGKTHPARGQVGTVVVAPRPLRLFGTMPERVYLEVEMDDMAGHRCGAEPHQVKRL